MKFPVNQIAAAVAVALLSHVAASQAVHRAHTTAAPAASKAVRSKAQVSGVEEEEASKPSKPGVEGITVHGHWILDLKDKDGKLLEHRDFHNSLLTYGTDVLAKLIAGMSVMGSLQINAGGFIIYRPDIANHGLPSCNNNPTSACVPNLTITYTSFDLTKNVPASLVTLSGSITPTAATTVSTVYTDAVSCALAQVPTTDVLTTESPARCAALDFDAGVSSRTDFFTGTSITPINVAPGQTLAITVVLSFS